MRRGHDPGIPKSEPRAKRAAAGHSPKGMDNLFTATNVVIPRGQPHIDALMDRVWILEKISAKEAGEHQRQASYSQQSPIARHGIQREKYAGDQQCGPEVLLQEKEDQEHGDRDQYRQQIFEPGYVDVPGNARQLRPAFLQYPQELPTLGEVAGEKEHDQDFDELYRLEAKQVHFRIADSGTVFEDDQRQRKSERCK